MTACIPHKCFISHSYRDEDAISLLHKSLPPEVSPFIFPPINMRPDEFVSNALIEAILSQEGLIYLLGGHSGKSFWVAFERDYGLRSKRRVVSFEPSETGFTPEDDDPKDIFVYPSFVRQDVEHVRRITHFMSRERFFNVWIDSAVLELEDWETTLRRSIQSVLDKGGYAVLFWSQAAARSSFIVREMEWVWQYKRNHILVALLEDIAPPSWLGDQLPPWLTPVPLFGDGHHSEMHRWDDLIVRIYWLVYNKHELD